MARWMRRTGAASIIGLLAGIGVLATARIPQARASGEAAVKVAGVVGLSATRAYARLHHGGLRVSFGAVQLDYATDPPVHVVAQSPVAGEWVAPGTVVHLRFGCPGCGAGSPGVPTRMPSYRVPRFIGRMVGAAWHWVRQKELYFIAYLGRLSAGSAPNLFDNYRVVRQRPRAGTTLQLGKGSRCCGGTGGSFRPTPLTVWTAQIRSA